MSRAAATAGEQRSMERVWRILEEHDFKASRIIPILQSVQEEYRYLPEEVMTYVATALDISPAKVFGVATFFSHFSLEPKGKYVIKICNGTACHVKGSGVLIETLQDYLGVTDKQKTTPDMLFTLETVSCLGACGLAPAVVINEKVYGQVTPEQAKQLVDGIKEEEGVS